MKLGKLIKIGIFTMYLAKYIKSKAEEVTAHVKNSFDFEPKAVCCFDVFLEQRKLVFKLDLMIRNLTDTDYSVAENMVKIKDLILFYPNDKNRTLARADLSGITLNFGPYAQKLIRNIPVEVYFNDINSVKFLIKNWPDVDIPYIVHYELIGKPQVWTGVINPKNLEQ